MIEYKIGEMVKSLAGHDKDSYYMIIGKEGEILLLADGRLKTIEKPKKKKMKHVQLVHSKTDAIGNMKISIITVNYNNAEGLKRTLDSVASQTCREFEHIIIDFNPRQRKNV